MLHNHCFQFLWWWLLPREIWSIFQKGNIYCLRTRAHITQWFCAIFLRAACNLWFVKLRTQTIFWSFYFYEILVDAYFLLSNFFSAFVSWIWTMLVITQWKRKEMHGLRLIEWILVIYHFFKYTPEIFFYMKFFNDLNWDLRLGFAVTLFFFGLVFPLGHNRGVPA